MHQKLNERIVDLDPQETSEWVAALDEIIDQAGPDRATYLLERLTERARTNGAELPIQLNTPYVNTIRTEEELPYPGDRAMERRIKSLIRWNAMAMVVHQNKFDAGIGGHISTYASLATLLEVGFNHFFHANTATQPRRPRLLPGPCLARRIRARVSRRPSHRGAPGEFPPRAARQAGPVVLSASVADARFLELPHRLDGPWSAQRHLPGAFHAVYGKPQADPCHGRKVWAFLGDGEKDEPESMGSLTLASREKLDNLIFVINCNLQRLDGPVRGNGKVIQELEAAYRGAGWNVIKVMWGERLGSICWRAT